MSAGVEVGRGKQVVELYRRQGYDFIAVTDHFLQQYGFPITDTTRLRRSDFTTLLGAELHTPAWAPASAGTSWRWACHATSRHCAPRVGPRAGRPRG